ncbi:MAG: putative nitrogen fixation protein NifT [Rhodospirillales bacterium]|nr:putative nitrogen fixation protein NifT [Rhodospirillales bacterium]MDG4575351.1 putative nitrogen fixation protein NifT [Defluviicoccus sp.]HOT82657.1 putative nitrogen fixation protein NifT [Candidatus Defluviicoccus seviourii]MDG4591174.1 putative nitrogen fixation protein NifT [Defluviicoccus sp.]MDG4603157.1 putative nitrogen fixation protein NifT [Defluviicoccus sp.]
MKVTISKDGAGFRVYVPKKDLEERVTGTEHAELWGGWIELANGWRLDLPPMAAAVRLPITIEARKHPDAD